MKYRLTLNNTEPHRLDDSKYDLYTTFVEYDTEKETVSFRTPGHSDDELEYSMGEVGELVDFLTYCLER